MLVADWVLISNMIHSFMNFGENTMLPDNFEQTSSKESFLAVDADLGKANEDSSMIPILRHLSEGLARIGIDISDIGAVQDQGF